MPAGLGIHQLYGEVLMHLALPVPQERCLPWEAQGAGGSTLGIAPTAVGQQPSLHLRFAPQLKGERESVLRVTEHREASGGLLLCDLWF